MPNTKIVDLTAKTIPSGTEEVPLNDGGLDRKITLANAINLLKPTDYVIFKSGSTYYLYDIINNVQTTNASYTTLLNSIAVAGEIKHLRVTYVPDNASTITLPDGSILNGTGKYNTIIDCTAWNSDAVLFQSTRGVSGDYLSLNCEKLVVKFPLNSVIGTGFLLDGCAFGYFREMEVVGGNIGVQTQGNATVIGAETLFEHCVFKNITTAGIYITGNAGASKGSAENWIERSYFWNNTQPTTGTGVIIDYSSGTRILDTKFEQLDKGIVLNELDATHLPDLTVIDDVQFELINTACITLNGSHAYNVKLGPRIRGSAFTATKGLIINNPNVNIVGTKSLSFPLLLKDTNFTQTVSNSAKGTLFNAGSGSVISVIFDTQRYIPIRAKIRAQDLSTYVGGTTLTINLVDTTGGATLPLQGQGSSANTSWNLTGSAGGGVSPAILLCGPSGMLINGGATNKNQKLDIYFADAVGPTTSVNISGLIVEIEVIDLMNG